MWTNRCGDERAGSCLNAFRAFVQLSSKSPRLLNSLRISEQPRRLDRACLHVKVACDLLAVIGKPQAVLHDFLHGVNDDSPHQPPAMLERSRGRPIPTYFWPPIILQRDFQFGTRRQRERLVLRFHLQIGESNGHVELVTIQLWEPRLYAGKESVTSVVKSPDMAPSPLGGTGDPSANWAAIGWSKELWPLSS